LKNEFYVQFNPPKWPVVTALHSSEIHPHFEVWQLLMPSTLLIILKS